MRRQARRGAQASERSAIESVADARKRRLRALIPWLLAIGIAISILPGLGLFGLQEPDEGRYSDIAATMLRTGDWLTPRQDDLRYFAKPPFAFWLSAASMGLLGVGELGARLPFALASCLTVLLTYLWGRHAFGRRAGLLAAAILATVPLFAVLARTVLVDIVLMCLTTTAMYSAYRALIPHPSTHKARRGWTLLFWIIAALAILTKGPLGLCLPLSGVTLYLCARREWRLLLSFYRPDGLMLMTLVAAPWYVFMQYRYPEYFYDFFVENNVERFVTGGPFGREAPLWFYVPVLCGALLPWSLALPGVFARAWRSRGEQFSSTAQSRVFLLTIAFVPIAIFSCSKSKHTYYLLSLLPALSIAMGSYVAGWISEPVRPRQWLVRVGGGALRLVAGGGFAALFIVLALFPGQATEFADSVLGAPDVAVTLGLVRPYLMGVAGVLAAGILGASFLLARGERGWASGVYVSAFLAAMGILPWVLKDVASLNETRVMAAEIERVSRPGETVAMFDHYYRGVPFYLQRPVVLWKAKRKEFSRTPDAVESEGRALGGDPENLRCLQDQHASVLWLLPSLRELAVLRGHSQLPVHTLVESERFVLARAEHHEPLLTERTAPAAGADGLMEKAELLAPGSELLGAGPVNSAPALPYER